MQNTNPESDLDLNKILAVLMRRRWIVLAASLIVFLTAALRTFTTQPVYRASTLLVIEKERGGGRTFTGGPMVEASHADYYQTQYKLIQSRTALEQVHQDLELGKTEDFGGPNGVAALDGAITVSPVLRSRLVYVNADSHDPELAAKVANALSNHFVHQNLAHQLFISKEILQVLQVNDNEPEARRLYESLPAVVNSALIQSLKLDLVKLEARHADLKQRYTAKHPEMRSVTANLAALKSQVRAETDRVVQSLKMDLSGKLKGNNVRIVDPAKIPKSPIRPRKLRALILGLFAGLALGLGLAFLVDSLDQTVRVQEDVEEKLGLPYLGTVPFFQVGDDYRTYKRLLDKEASFISESFKNIRTMIEFAQATDKARSFLVTSAMQTEGKSLIAANLAVAFSQLGQSVLLIDGDLRRPTLQKTFGARRAPGLSDFLAKGRSADELERHVQKTEVPGVSILVCGTVPPNPSELLNTPRLAAATAWAKERYDRVIVDCPPLLPIHDSLLWSRLIPSTVFVVRYGQTRVQAILATVERLKGAGGKLAGVVVNAAKAGSLGYSGYGYYQYHNYDSYLPQKRKKETATADG